MSFNTELFNWRSRYTDLLTSCSHLFLLALALHSGSVVGWIICLALISAISFFAWASNYKRGRYIADTPTSRIASAAQGYVELYGRASADADNLVASPLSGARCVWYRFWVYRKESGDKGWVLQSEGVSDSTFEISDGTGKCIIDPDHAEIIAPERKVSYQSPYKHVEELLYAGGIYALGNFTTVGGASAQLDLRQDVSDLLAEWKRDPVALKQRFDLDGNGEIDLKEWELARRAAHREVEQQHRELRTASGIHVMRAPRNGRPFLLSSHTPQKLRNTYLCWGMVHLAIAITASCTSFWLWQGHHLQELFG